MVEAAYVKVAILQYENTKLALYYIILFLTPLLAWEFGCNVLFIWSMFLLKFILYIIG